MGGGEGDRPEVGGVGGGGDWHRDGVARGGIAEEVAGVERDGGYVLAWVLSAEALQHEGVGVGAWGAGVGVVGCCGGVGGCWFGGGGRVWGFEEACWE